MGEQQESQKKKHATVNRVQLCNELPIRDVNYINGHGLFREYNIPNITYQYSYALKYSMMMYQILRMLFRFNINVVYIHLMDTMIFSICKKLCFSCDI